jgi:hypothetical protein
MVVYPTAALRSLRDLDKIVQEDAWTIRNALMNPDLWLDAMQLVQVSWQIAEDEDTVLLELAVTVQFHTPSVQ